MSAQTRRATTLDVRVDAVRSGRDVQQFINLPYRHYRNDANWVPPLRMAQKDILNRRRHPFYKTSDAEMFLARRNGEIVGRVMAILNHAHNEFHQERAGFFGFFESEDDPTTAEALLGAAGDWVRSRGAEVIRGPVNPSTNYECGLLIDGCDSAPRVMMTYNPRYYAGLIEGCGFGKAMDLFAYDIAADYFIRSDKLARVAERIRNKDRISIRTVNLKDFKREVELLRVVYNDAWSKNWGFVPFSRAEFDHLAKDLKQLVDARVVLIAEQETTDGARKPVGFLLAVPDINIALKRVADGRLLPLGLMKLLWHSRKIDHMRVITMGVVQSHVSFGIGALFLSEILKRGPAAGYPKAEMSWVLENNVLMNRAAELIGGRLAKKYRIYEKRLR